MHKFWIPFWSVSFLTFPVTTYLFLVSLFIINAVREIRQEENVDYL